jgi:hypothetical protein
VRWRDRDDVGNSASIQRADRCNPRQRRRDCGDEALQSVRNGWQLLVVEGSGRFADELSAVVLDAKLPSSTEIAEIVRSGHVALFHVDEPALTLKKELRRLLI